MTLDMDLRQPFKKTVGSAELPHLSIRSLPAVDSDQFAEPASRGDSDLSECACPYDCLRDHENE